MRQPPTYREITDDTEDTVYQANEIRLDCVSIGLRKLWTASHEGQASFESRTHGTED